MMPVGNALVLMSLPTAGRLACVCRGSIREEALPRAEHRMDGQQGFIRKRLASSGLA